MRKMFVFLWAILFGCSIVPDESFDSPSDGTLKKIIIKANEGQAEYVGGLPVSSLEAVASHSANKTTLQFEGTLDPFWFKPKVGKIEYEFNARFYFYHHSKLMCRYGLRYHLCLFTYRSRST